MSDKDLKIERYQSLRNARYPIVERLVLAQQIPDELNHYELSLILTLRNRSYSDSSRLILSFTKVRGLQLNPGNLEISFSLLSIVPMNDGWENVNFKVFNDEQDVEFSFYCDDFSASIIEEPDK